ncbi:hypothetical protein M422DRAFT_777770 [Sphaerobolus stellatus SS14]|nr:hypothetical protein M422DRAFT_777770 [Sphaerobolus stellatus SS14]
MPDLLSSLEKISSPEKSDENETLQQTVDHEGDIRSRLQRHKLGFLLPSQVEAQGIEPIPEDERETFKSLDMFWVWISISTVISGLPIGILGPKAYNLSFLATMVTLITFQFLGALAVGFIAAMGARLGMRTMVITRYSYGYWGGVIISILAILSQLGWALVGAVLAGQILHGVNSNIPSAVGILIISISSLIISFFGYNALNLYEKYAWIIMAAIFFMMLGLGDHAGFNVSAHAPPSAAGTSTAINVLNFGAAMFATVISWCPMAADFNCRLPSNTPTYKIIPIIVLGNLVPNALISALGAALVTVPAYSDAYDVGDAAGLIKKVFGPWGRGGDFLLVVSAFSIIAANVIDNYSSGLALQTFIPPLRRVPRPLLTVLTVTIYTAAGIAGREHFSAILNNFLSLLGYWVTPWFVIIFEEHILFRKPKQLLKWYDAAAYDSSQLLPVGLAAVFASLCSAGGVVVGMAQVWYIGPLAARFGFGGGDMGSELAAVIAAVLYPPLRYLEIRRWGR